MSNPAYQPDAILARMIQKEFNQDDAPALIFANQILGELKLQGFQVAPAPVAPLGAVEALPHYSDPISERIMTEARERAAQAWCDKATSHLVMEPDLAEAFARRLAPLLNEIDKLGNFIMREIPGEPSQNEGAADTAIRLLRPLSTLPAPPAPQVQADGVYAALGEGGKGFHIGISGTIQTQYVDAPESVSRAVVLAMAAHQGPAEWQVIEALNGVSLIDIWLTAARENGFAHRVSGQMLDVFAKAIRSYFAKKATSLIERDSSTPELAQ
jgi:hypothetical protein